MKKGFTLLELLVTVAIVGMITSILVSELGGVFSQTDATASGATKRQLTKAAELYWVDMGFWPPDVGRGWDPGFERPLPWNPDVENGSHSGSPGINCYECPANWQDIVLNQWDGPYYLWPDRTLWGGRYDYNIWPNGATRYGCPVAAGIYAGAQGDYSNNNNIPAESEQILLDKGIDNDGCLNGESQLVLFRF